MVFIYSTQYDFRAALQAENVILAMKRVTVSGISKQPLLFLVCLARIIHESPAATTDMGVLPGVLGCRPL